MIIEARDLLGPHVLIVKLTSEHIGDAIKADTDRCELTRFKLEEYEYVTELPDGRTIHGHGHRTVADENGSTVLYIDRCSFDVIDRRTGELIAKARL